jgi:ubiquinone/menaquinone biosynthesis C-methylase UbiE
VSFYSLLVSQFVNSFAGTASFYARFRPGYPSALYDLLSDQSGLNHSTSVLDLGCGPGIIALALASRTKWMTGVDPDTEMLKEASVAARVGGIDKLAGF